MNTYIWLAIMIASLLIEVCTAGLVAVWFAIAGFVSMMLSILGAHVGVQIGAFVAVSVILIVLFYKKLKDNISTKTEKTNIDAIIGKEAIVEEDIEDMKPGRVNVSGMSWSAIIEKDSEPITKGERVKILSIDGVKLVCKKIEQKHQINN